MKHIFPFLLFSTLFLLVSCNELFSPKDDDNDSKGQEFEMIYIPAGSFQMGDIRGVGNSDEIPVRNITLTKNFWMSNVEITQKKWEEVSDTAPTAIFNKGNNIPVNYVSWMEVIEFCNRLSKAEFYDTCYTIKGNNVTCDFDADGYRLPTEAEWEYACRAGTTTDFYTGNMSGDGYGEDNVLDRAGWYIGNKGVYDPQIKVVGRKKPNSFGLYDMHGNVSEMCWDIYQETYDPADTLDPTGPETGDVRTIRGGNSHSDATQCRSSSRSRIRYIGYNTSSQVGFRVVRTQN